MELEKGFQKAGTVISAFQENTLIGLVEVLDDGFAIAYGNMDPETAVTPPGLKQENAGLRIFAQAVGQHTAGRTGTDDDEIKLIVGRHGELP